MVGEVGEAGMSEHKIESLPKWAQRHIAELKERVRLAEATIPWTEPGMQWFTLLKDHKQAEGLFLCDKNGTFRIATVGPGDRVFVGRAKREESKE